MIACSEANLHATLVVARPTIRRMHLTVTGAECGRDEYGRYWLVRTRQGVTVSLAVERSHGKVAVRIVGAVA